MSMPATWPVWDVSESAAEELGRHVPNALYGGIPRNVESGADVVRLENIIGKDEVTRILAGTDDKKSRAWKSAKRSQQRYRRGERGKRGISPDKAGKLTDAARNSARHRFLSAAGPLQVKFAVTWMISRDAKKSTPQANLTGEPLAAFKAAVTGGKYLRALQIVTWAWGLPPEEVVELVGVQGCRIGTT